MTATTRRVAPRRLNLEPLWGLLLPLGVAAVGALVWEVLASRSTSLIIPTFTETATALYDLLFVRVEIWEALLISNQAFIVGFIISVLVGVPMGFILGRSAVLDSVTDPYISMAIAMPTAPLIPLIIMALGIGLWSRVAVVVVFALVFIIVNVRAGVRGIDRSLIEMARSLGANERQIWREVLFPASTPALLAGLRLGMARSIDAMIVSELLLVAVGIGHLLLVYRGRFQGGLMFATVLVVAIEASLLITLMRAFERRLTRWL